MNKLPKTFRKDPKLCSWRGCKQPWTREIKKGNLCDGHYRIADEARPKCSRPGCGRPVTKPISAGLCLEHQPKDLTSLELQVLDDMARGIKPVEAVMGVTGLPRVEAARKLTSMSKKPSFRQRVPAAMEATGLTPERLMAELAKNVDAVRVGIDKEGGTVDLGRDYKASNQAIGLAIKLGGMLPEKEQQERAAVFNIERANIMVPAPKPPEPDQPVFVIKKDR